MQDYHHDRARALLANATQIVTPEEVRPLWRALPPN